MAERYNRTHQNKIRALLFDAGFPNTFWGWASDAATYIYNRVPHVANGNITPYEKFYGKRPNVRNIRVFGTLAHTLLPQTKRLDGRTGKRYIIGFTDTGYIVYNPANSKTERSCNIRTDETRNYGDDLRNRKHRTVVEIDFTAGDTSGDITGTGPTENKNKTAISNSYYIAGNSTVIGGNNKNTGDGKITAGDSTADGTINESVTLDSCVSLGNSVVEKTANKSNDDGENKVTRSSATEGKILGKRQAVTIRNEDSDSDMEEDEEESIYLIDLGSNISLGDETEKSADVTEWDPGKIAVVNDFEPAATSTQCVNTFAKIGAGQAKMKVDKKLRVIPKNYTQATTGEVGKILRLAIEKEMNAMAEHYVWDIVERPKNCKPLPCAWKFLYKDDGTAKARLYLVENREPFDSIQNTYSPVTDMMTVLWLCLLAVKYGVLVYQMDVTTAFLNADLDALRYMRLPDGLTLDKTKYACRLNKAIYELRISPRCWYLKIEQDLLKLGLRQSVHEPCLFYERSNDGFVILTVYVDDLLVTGTDKARIEFLKQKLKEIYKIKNLGIMQRFLGMDVERKGNGAMKSTQTEYTEEIIVAAKLTEANTKPTPMVRFGNFPTVKEGDYLPNVIEYKSILGKLQFLASHTRPDISHAVNYCARY